MELYIKKVNFNTNSNFSYTITFEVNEILDVEYFAKCLGFKNFCTLLKILEENNIKYELSKNVLLFSSIKSTKYVCEKIIEKIGC